MRPFFFAWRRTTETTPPPSIPIVSAIAIYRYCSNERVEYTRTHRAMRRVFIEVEVHADGSNTASLVRAGIRRR